MAGPFERRFAERSDERSDAARDRDRVLYASAFRRLSGVTQVVAAAEGDFFHNRLMHSLKVAQLARRIAEKLRDDHSDAPGTAPLDPDVCEAAALIHDMGHPPFGHVGEAELDRLVVGARLPDGFEGNAQSFRIVTRLAQRHEQQPGLNLTRDVLDGALKYPWLRAGRDESRKRHRKYGAYNSDRGYFEWVRADHPHGSDRLALSAEIMDWADDVTYAVHDIEDFYRAGLVPLDRLVDNDYRAVVFDAMVRRWERNDDRSPAIPADERDAALQAFERLFRNEEGPLGAIIEPYAGSREQRRRLRSTTSALIRRYLAALGVDTAGDEPSLQREPVLELEVRMLKQLMWQFVILSPALRTQQHGHITIIRDLFRIFLESAEQDDHTLLPVSIVEALKDGTDPVRAVADGIASLTEQQATLMWRRLTGIDSGTLGSYPDR